MYYITMSIGVQSVNEVHQVIADVTEAIKQGEGYEFSHISDVRGYGTAKPAEPPAETPVEESVETPKGDGHGEDQR